MGQRSGGVMVVPNKTRALLAKKEVATRFTGQADATPGAWQ